MSDVTDPIADTPTTSTSDHVTDPVTDHSAEEKYFSSDDETYGDSIHTSNPEINEIINFIIKYIHKIIGVTIDVRPLASCYAEPDWFNDLRVESDFNGESYLPDDINNALLEKIVYDEYYQLHYENNDPDLDELTDMNYPILSEHTYTEICQMLADAFNSMHTNVEDASDTIEFESGELIDYLKIHVTESTTIEEINPRLNEYFLKILDEAWNYDHLLRMVHEVGFEMTHGCRLDELLDSSEYVLSDDSRNQGWWSVEHDVYYLIEDIENELRRKYGRKYKTYYEYNHERHQRAADEAVNNAIVED